MLGAGFSLTHFGIRPFPTVRGQVQRSSGDPSWPAAWRVLVWGQTDRSDICCTGATSYNISPVLPNLRSLTSKCLEQQGPLIK